MPPAVSWIRERVFDHPVTTAWGVLVLSIAILLWAGAAKINALTQEVTALSGLFAALGEGWHAVAMVPAAAAMMLMRDKVK